jgi:transcriptional regulator with XRE-family HTH domain
VRSTGYMSHMDLGEYIRENRAARGYTIYELAEMVGHNFTYISKVEHSRCVLGWDALEAYATALDVPIEELIWRRMDIEIERLNKRLPRQCQIDDVQFTYRTAS